MGRLLMRRQAWQGVLLILAIVSAVPALAQQPPGDSLKTQRREVAELYRAGRYAEALVRQRIVVERIESAEMAGAGRPGTRTADALGNLAWYALTAREFDEALAASERAHALAAGQVWSETNRAHALLFLGRLQEARQIYLAHKGVQLARESGKTWEDMVQDDFEKLRKRGLAHAAFQEIETELGLGKVQRRTTGRRTGSERSATKAAGP
jgi:tetratricopeptide (TPR) repeat protein